MEETTTHAETKHKKHRKFSKTQKHLAIFIAGALIAVTALTAVRFALVTDNAVHYHANFALYVNGQKDAFDSFTFYEEVASCDSTAIDNPKVRTHMHDKKPGLIHVHDGGVTWGQFFENLGYTLGDNVLDNRKGVFTNQENGAELSFILNGEPVSSVADKLIESEDKLLINYGNDTKEVLQERFSQVPDDAKTANTTKDPAACSGGHELTFQSRLKQAIGLPDSKGHGH